MTLEDVEIRWQGLQTAASHEHGFGDLGTCPVSLIRRDPAVLAGMTVWATSFQSSTVHRLKEFLNITVRAHW